MNGLSLRWKLFRIMCILQLIVVLFCLVSDVVRLFQGGNTWSELIGVISYGFVFLFVCQGLAILNDNYPDTPLSQSQKRRFNLLFLVNFILIAFLFSKVVVVWQILPFLSLVNITKSYILYNFTFLLLRTVFVFIFHLLFLFGMYRLRQVIYKNTVNSWVEQFDQQEPHQS
jgi:hypothetical protein